MAKIHKFGLANSLLDSPMATWLTLTGTLIFKKKKELIKSVQNYLLYEILCKEIASQWIHAATLSLTQCHGSEILVGSLPQFAE